MSAAVIAAIAVILVAVVLGAIVTGIFNKLVTYRNRYKNAFAQIEAQLKRRHDLIALAEDGAAAAGVGQRVARAVDEVGQPSEAHIRYAARLVNGLPPAVFSAAHKPHDARAVVVYLAHDGIDSTARSALGACSVRGCATLALAGMLLSPEATVARADTRRSTGEGAPPRIGQQVRGRERETKRRSETSHVLKGPNNLVRRGEPMAVKDRGFASMPAHKGREIASKGGTVSHAKGVAHEWTSEEAREAGHKGGKVAHQRKRKAMALAGPT